MHGQEILDTLQALKSRSAVALLIRHAERYPITDPTRSNSIEITPAGSKMAALFGSRLAGFSRIRIFHSPLKRCRQTAESIAQGAAATGAVVEYVGVQTVLGIGYILDPAETARLAGLHGDHFVRLWFTGKIAANIIEPAPLIARAYLDYLSAKLPEAAGGDRLDIHLSHDWNIMVLRELLLGVRHEDAGWLAYLDGVAFEPRPGALRAVYRDRSVTHAPPWRLDPAP